MIISCKRQELQTAVSNVSRAVSSKSSIPALEGILLKAENNQVSLYGYDLELGITTTIEASRKKNKAILSSAQRFLGI